jgi:hypothetical protein
MDDSRSQDLSDALEENHMKRETLTWIGMIFLLLFLWWLGMMVSYGFLPLFLLYIGFFIWKIYDHFAV